ncbi:unnamed protein product, partial [marine sediment metagenome]
AKNMDDTLPFGTQHDITSAGYDFATHSLFMAIMAVLLNAPKLMPEILSLDAR